MKHYLDITLLPGADISINILRSILYQFLHLELVLLEKNENIQIAVSFPEFDESKNVLGGKLRLFSENEDAILRIKEKIKNRFSSYTHCTEVRLVPKSASNFVVYKRVQPNITPAKLRRLVLRKAKMGTMPLNEVESKFESLLESQSKTHVKDPFIRMSSSSSGKNFCLFIRREKSTEFVAGKFNSYGLGLAVPEF